MDCLAIIKFIDFLDQPIQGLVHQLWVDNKLISQHTTMVDGESVWFRRPIGKIVEVKVRSHTTSQFELKAKIELIGEKTTFVIKSPKVLIKDVELANKDQALGEYTRSTYTVSDGDGLIKIAKENNINLHDFLILNNLTLESKIHVGQILQLPVKDKKKPESLGTTKTELKKEVEKVKTVLNPKRAKYSTKIILVQKTDTLALICKLTHNTREEIIELNYLDEDMVYPGQKLRIYEKVLPTTQSKDKANSTDKSKENNELKNKPAPKPAQKPQVKQQASKNQEKTPVAKVESTKEINGLLVEACGGEKHCKRALRNIATLHPIYQDYVVRLINLGYQELGICWVVTDAYRSPKEQNGLSKAVSNAKGLQSYHQYGLAVDMCSVRDGELTTYHSCKETQKFAIPDLKLLGPVGEKIGLEWVGRWTSLPDNPHFELKPNGLTWRELKPQLLELGLSNYKQLVFEPKKKKENAK